MGIKTELILSIAIFLQTVSPLLAADVTDKVNLNSASGCSEAKGQYFDGGAGKCFILIGKPCNKTSTTHLCTPSSFCSRGTPLDRRYLGEAKCTCDDFFFHPTMKVLPSKENSQISKDRKKCFVRAGNSCPEKKYSQDRSCNTELSMSCINGKCACESEPLHQKYIGDNSGRGECFTLVGSFCSAASAKCISNASCDPDGKVCQCNEGWTEEEDGTCIKVIFANYGESCSGNSSCNLERAMHCRDGKCTCIDNIMEYDSTKEACFGTLGSKCGLLVEVLDFYKKEVTTHCGPLLKCSEQELFSKSSRKCVPVPVHPDALTSIP